MPTAVLNELDLSDMNLQHGSFIDEEMKEHHSDIIYQVRLAETDSNGYIYFLFEHKSYPDKQVAFQLLRYQMRFWERQMNDQEPLSPIIPIVIYHGERRWHISTEFIDLVTTAENREVLRPYLLNFRYLLGDFSYLSDEEIRGQILLRVFLSILRAIFDPNLRHHLPRLIKLVFKLQKLQTGMEHIHAILYYLTIATGKISRTDLREALRLHAPKGEAVMNTIAQAYIQEGIEKGVEQGLDRGARKTLRENIAELMFIRLGVPEVRYTAVLQTIDDTAVLRHLWRVAATAESPTEFEQQLPTPS